MPFRSRVRKLLHPKRSLYTSLNQTKQEIRLLQLLPRSKGSGINCTLNHCRLDRAPDYIALSYCWGDPLDTEEIAVDGASTPVTKNLHAALLHMRHQNDPKTLWVDAICINQADDVEKSWQVQLMGEIYKRADSLTVWLGPATAGTDAAMEYLGKLGARDICDHIYQNRKSVLEQWTGLISESLVYADRVLPTFGDENLRSSELPMARMENHGVYLPDVKETLFDLIGLQDEITEIPVQNLQELFALPWWSRTWVIQEVALARTAVFRCGTKLVDHSHIGGALMVLHNFQNSLLGVPRFNLAAEARARVVAWELALGTLDRPCTILRIAGSSVATLTMLLRVTCVFPDEGPPWQSLFYATDPRDKIFGILGLATERQELEKYGLIPNYTLSCRKVYANAMKALIRQGQTSLLCHVQFPKTLEDLPSWVPDWSRVIDSPLQHMKWHGGFDPEYGACKNLRQVSQEVTAADDTEEGSAEVVLSGLVHDGIIDNERGLESINQFDWPDGYEPLLGWLTKLEELKMRHKDSFADEAQRHTAIFRTSTADFSLSYGYRTKMTQASVLAATLVIYRERPEVLEELGVGATLREHGFFDGVTDDALLYFHADDYLNEVRYRCCNRAPFITSKGHLGLGPKHLKVGDVTAVLAGWQVPCVLRPAADGKFEFVGEAYVDGIMDGEAVGDRVEGDLITLI